jgi:hypothetical protein
MFTTKEDAMTFPNPLSPLDPLNADTLNPLFNALYDSVVAENGIFSAVLYPDEFTVLNGNDIALALHVASGEIYGQQTTAALDDEWEHGAYLSADTYTLRVRALRSSSSGILKILVDDAVVATFDLYNAVEGIAVAQGGFTVAVSKWCNIKGLVDSKNASSSNYNASIVKIYIRGNSA